MKLLSILCSMVCVCILFIQVSVTDPDILAFLSNKKDVQTRRSTSEEKKGGSQVDQERAGIADDLKGRWVNMDVVEGDKMEWMKRLPETDKNVCHFVHFIRCLPSHEFS